MVSPYSTRPATRRCFGVLSASSIENYLFQGLQECKVQNKSLNASRSIVFERYVQMKWCPMVHVWPVLTGVLLGRLNSPTIQFYQSEWN